MAKLLERFFPLATNYDFTEDPPGGMDPLGFMAMADNVADLYMPGFTARMWRPRFITLAAVTSWVADQVVNQSADGKINRKDARLAFERIYVLGIIQGIRDGSIDAAAKSRLPGRSLVEAVIDSNENLTAQNYLVAAAVNGAFGVIARLARNLQIIRDDDSPESAPDLIAHWAHEQNLEGFLSDEDTSGSKLLKRWVNKTADYVVSNKAPTRSWLRDSSLDLLRPDKPGREEKKFILGRICDNKEPIRTTFFQTLQKPELRKKYKSLASEGNRGVIEAEVLHSCIAELNGKTGIPQSLLRKCLLLADAFQSIASPMRHIFETTQWCLTRHNGIASIQEICAEPAVKRSIERARKQLTPSAQKLNKALGDLEGETVLTDFPKESFTKLISQVQECSESSAQAVTAVLKRHCDIQRENRGKSPWIEVADRCLLRDGFGLATEDIPDYLGQYKEALRIYNACEFLEGLL